MVYSEREENRYGDNTKGLRRRVDSSSLPLAGGTLAGRMYLVGASLSWGGIRPLSATTLQLVPFVAQGFEFSALKTPLDCVLGSLPGGPPV